MKLGAAAVGHVEWVQFVRVDRLPTAGEIVPALDFWEEPAGGGPAAAMQMLKLAGRLEFYTALGNDEIGRHALELLTRMGLVVHAVFRDEPTRRAVTYVDARGERTITVIGRRLDPRAADPLPWNRLRDARACYFTAGDVGALAAARDAGTLVATSRVLPILKEAGLRLDALVGSSSDPAERYEPGDLEPVPDLVVLTDGERGGRFSVSGGDLTDYPAVPVAAPVVDRYGAGDSFAGGLTYGLGAGLPARDAIALAARCGAAVLGGRGPYESQITRAEPS